MTLELGEVPRWYQYGDCWYITTGDEVAYPDVCQAWHAARRTREHAPVPNLAGITDPMAALAAVLLHVAETARER